MVPVEDLFGLGLGSLYALAAPSLVFILLRKPLVLQVRYLVLGAAGGILAMWLAAAILTGALLATIDFVPRSGRPSIVLFTEWATYASFPLSYLLLATALLAFFSAGVQRLSAAIAYAIGTFGLMDVVQSYRLWQLLERGLAVNEFGTAAVFGAKTYVSDAVLRGMFSYGVPSAASSISKMLVGVILTLLIAQGLLRRNWKLVVSAFAIAIGLAGLRAAYGALSLSLALAAPVTSFGARTISGHEIELAFGIAAVFALSWRSGLRRLLSAPDDSQSPIDKSKPRGLLGVWLDQGARSQP